MKGEVDVKLDKNEIPYYLKGVDELLRDGFQVTVEVINKKGKTDFILRIRAEEYHE